MKGLIDKIKNIKTIDQYYISYALATQTLVGGGTTHLLTEIVRDFLNEKDVYLEIGIYQAWNFSLISHFAICDCIGVDNFSQSFQEDERYNLSTKDLVERNISTIGRGQGRLIEGDFREILKSDKIPKKSVKVYFYDGPHEYQDQIDGVEMVFPYLQDEAIIFVDDWHSENVKFATQYFLKNHKELTLLKILDGPGTREFFNQGQVVFHYKRNKEEDK